MLTADNSDVHNQIVKWVIPEKS